MYENDRPPEPEPMRVVGDRIISERQYQREIWRANYDIEQAQLEEAYRLQCLEQGIEYKTPAERVSPGLMDWLPDWAKGIVYNTLMIVVILLLFKWAVHASKH